MLSNERSIGFGSQPSCAVHRTVVNLYTIADQRLFIAPLGLDLLKKAEIKRQANKAAAKATAGAAEYQVIAEDGAADAEIEEKLKNRYAAKKAKDFATADQIRDDLKAAGIEITDIPNGVKWKKI